MKFHLPELPYNKNAFGNFLSEESFEYHYGKHHKAYIDKVNELLEKEDKKYKSLEDIVKSASGKLFEQGAQAWNHTFYWNGMSPQKSDLKDGGLFDQINRQYGSIDEMKQQFCSSGAGVFGSGWVWLVKNPENQLKIINTSNADNPFRDGFIPLLVADVWEHAYYIDHRNERAKFLKEFCQYINWQNVEKRFDNKEVEPVSKQMS